MSQPSSSAPRGARFHRALLLLVFAGAPFATMVNVGCEGSSSEDTHEHGEAHDHDHGDGADHSHASEKATSGHAHAPQFGGQLIEVGDHFANLEVVHDADVGELRVYVLDGCADNLVRIAQPTMEAQLKLGDAGELYVKLDAVADDLSGETVGDTSLFTVRKDELMGVGEFGILVQAVTIQGERFEKIEARIDGGQQ